MKRKVNGRPVQRRVQRTARSAVVSAPETEPPNGPDQRPFPTSEAEAPERQPHPLYPDRWADGTQRPGFPGPALKDGRYSADPSKLPASMQEAIGDIEAFRVGLESDQGGADEIETIRRGYVHRLTEAETLVRLLGHDLRVNGVFTVKRRVRSTVGVYLSAVDRWDKLAQRLGMGRRQRDLSTMTASEYRDYIDEQDPQARPDSGATDSDLIASPDPPSPSEDERHARQRAPDQ
jgi:hypothetical protein